MIVRGVSSGPNIFRDIDLFGRVSVASYPLLAADNRLVWQDFLLNRAPKLDEETTTYKPFTQHLTTLYMGLGDRVFIDIALNIKFLSVDLTFAIPLSVLPKKNSTFVLGINCLAGHSCGDFLAKHEQTTTQDELRPAIIQFTVLPLRIAFATAVMIFWYLESIGHAVQFSFVLLCFSISRWSRTTRSLRTSSPSSSQPNSVTSRSSPRSERHCRDSRPRLPSRRALT
jgi:hypothetical protein